MQLDFGKTPLRNPRTGDLYVDEDGNIPMIEGSELATQECIVALETVRGEEVFDDSYGFPLYDLIKNPTRLEIESLVKTCVLSTLDTQHINTIEKASIADMRYEDGTITVRVILTTINGMTSDMTFGVDSPFQMNME